MRALLAFGTILGWSVAALAQTSPGFNSNTQLSSAALNSAIASRLLWSTAGAGMVQATGRTSARALSDIGADIFNVMDYGAKCDDTTDDATAINAAFTAARASPATSLTQPFTIVGPTTRRCLIKSTINMTGFIKAGWSVKGLNLDCAVNQGLCVDGLTSRWGDLDMSINGQQTNGPAVGLQIGRISTTSSDDLRFSHLVITGWFTPGGSYSYGTGLYNFASENLSAVDTYIYNRSTTVPSYAMILDAYNHFNVTSAFVTQTVPVNTQESMDGDNFYGGEFLTAGSSPALWMGGTVQTQFLNSYLATVGGSGVPGTCVIDLYELNALADQKATFDIHLEHAGITDGFCIDGTSTAPVFTSFKYHDANGEYTNSAFKVTGSAASVGLDGADISLATLPTGNTVKLFDNPTIWTVSGSVYLPNIANWNEPLAMNGRVCIAGVCTNYIPTEVLNRNPDFVVDQVAGNQLVHPISGTQALVDGWRNTVAGGIATNTYAFTDTISSPGGGFTNFEQAAVSTPISPSATQENAMQSVIEGPDFAPMQWGSAAAQPITVDFLAWSDNAGTFSDFFQNNGASRSYVLNYVLTANAWTHIIQVIPGDTAGTWFTSRNRPGLVFGFNLAGGSNFQASPNAWQAGAFYATSTTTNYSNISGAHFRVAAVHVRSGPFELPYKARPLVTELTNAQHWFSKSFESVIQPAQNAGPVGAVTFVLPYAYSSGITAGTNIPFPKTMYSANDTGFPPISFYSTGAATANCYNSTKSRDSGAASVVNEGDSGFGLSCALISGDAAGDQIQVHWSAFSGQ